MSDEAVNTYPSTIKTVLNTIKLKRCVIKQLKDFLSCFVFNSVLDQYKTQEIITIYVDILPRQI